MFTDDFLESSARVVRFPGVYCETFSQLLHFLYTDSLAPTTTPENCLALLELADRLVLPRLTSLVECAVVVQLAARADRGQEVSCVLCLSDSQCERCRCARPP